MTRYRPRISEVEAIQFTGHNAHEIIDFEDARKDRAEPNRVQEWGSAGLGVAVGSHMSWLRNGDWLIHDTEGNFSVYSDRKFVIHYELVEED